MKNDLLSQIKLENGYYISDVKSINNEIYIDIDYKLKSVPCPMCKIDSRVHDRLKKQWRHINYGSHKVYITFRNPRVKCDNHGVKVSSVSWAKPKHRFTIAFEDLVCKQAENMSFLQIAKELDEHDTRIRRVVKRSQNEEII